MIIFIKKRKKDFLATTKESFSILILFINITIVIFLKYLFLLFHSLIFLIIILDIDSLLNIIIYKTGINL